MHVTAKKNTHVPSAAREFLFTDSDFFRIRGVIHQRAGIALGEHKREMVYSRLSRRLRELGFTRFSDYLALLESDADSAEWQSFTNALTTNLTAFFREPHHFPLLARHVCNCLSPVAVWCSAASTGEEPYSIAITLLEALGNRTSSATVLATDINTQVLAKAAAGVFKMEQVSKLPADRLKRFFLRGSGAQAGNVRIRPEVAAMVDFAQVNLLDPQWTVSGPFDAIFCRNVMIYFDKPTQHRILQRFAQLLKPDGLLFAGHSENFSYVSSLFRLRGQTVYELASAQTRSST